MKSDEVFILEQSGWPALLVDGAGVICRANLAAIRLFGPAVEGSGGRLAGIWAGDKGVEQFLAQWERYPEPTAVLKVRNQGGQILSKPVSVCTWSREGQKYFLLQWLAGGGANGQTGGEEEALHKQKLDCALQLARTVALDFNNALTSILGHSSLMLSQMEPNHPWRGWVLEVEKSAARAAEIASDLGAFSQQEKEPRQQTAGNLNLVLQRTVEIFEQSAEPALEWQVQWERKLFAAKFDEAKLQQAFVKILENAREALPKGGRISLQTRNVEVSQPAQDRNVQLAPGAYVCVEISDNGAGMGPEVLPRIFEPFFTTKGAKHRGLGLAWVYGIVTNHGGAVAVSSQLNAGTSVRVYLPAEKRIVKDNGLAATDLKGSQSILMVDDEDLLLTMGQTILSAYGYRVQTANGGQKALELLAQKGAPVDLVITDLVMPAMSGRELVEHIRRAMPGTRILCTSGYVWPGSQDELSYLQKPFTAQELLQKVKRVLTA